MVCAAFTRSRMCVRVLVLVYVKRVEWEFESITTRASSQMGIGNAGAANAVLLITRNFLDLGDLF